ncbi:DNA cytosine methyltransferase [Pseudoalteromonas shioyasakiensis]|uniref:DNA cytosine methyltransferase n=1 Tax=Pseudoalteromonas shioyasakiensis TaxID=1190813 RepID=UPI000782F84C|nr:DNA cytosine methyltransferase [Pseudoalteromonas shioyasakiensis]
MILDDEISVDFFCGGGGASLGYEWATGKHIDYAINHDPAAIAMHKMNHPYTKHARESVWNVDPVAMCAGKKIGFAWFSPDCTHFTIASGGKPVEKNIRALAWVVVKCALLVQVRSFGFENVKEFKTWGPLITDEHGNSYPDPERKGETFNGFIAALTTGLKPNHPAWKEAVQYADIQYNIALKLKLFKGLGYDLKQKEITASSVGAATTRPRFFMFGRLDGKPVRFPKELPIENQRPISECIDWSLEGESIFTRKRPLAQKTLKRIEIGLDKFVFNHPNPFIAPIPFTKADHSKLAASFVLKLRNGCVGHTMNEPMHTITSGGNHFYVVNAFLVKYFGTATARPVTEPVGTFTTKDRYALVTVHRQLYKIFDIKLRVFTPKELFLAMGFNEDYKISHDENGKPISKSEQVKRVGNAVSPLVAKALIKANQEPVYINSEVA